jgi:hypothetical protein
MIEHNINGIYSYYPFKGTTLTAAGLQSGQPINRIHLVLVLQI